MWDFQKFRKMNTTDKELFYLAAINHRTPRQEVHRLDIIYIGNYFR